MWLAGDFLFIAAMAAILVGWMRHDERDTARSERQARRRAGGDPDAGVAPRGASRRGARPDAERQPRSGTGAREVLEVPLRVDVAARNDGDDRPATEGVEAELAGVERERGDRQGARRLDDEAALFGGEADAGRDLRLGNGDDRVEQAREVGERPAAERPRPRPVGDRPRDVVRGPRDDLGRPRATPARRRPAPARRRSPARPGPAPGSRRRRRSRARRRRSGRAPPRRPAASSAISRPTVPWPAMTRSSSNGGMIARPRSAAIRSATAWRSSLAVPTTTISAPSAATRARLISGASEGMTTTAGAPRRRAARATPWAWLPDE